MLESFVEYTFASNLMFEAAPAPENLHQEVKGTIRCLNLDDQYEEAGRIKATILDLERAAAEGIELQEVFDQDKTTLEIWERFYAQAEDMDRSLADLLHGSNLLVIDKIAIFHKYRGKNLALHAIADMLHSFSATASLAILKVYPLQFGKGSASFDPRLRMDLLPRDWDESKSKLVEYYEKLGFQCFMDSDFMFVQCGGHCPPPVV